MSGGVGRVAHSMLDCDWWRDGSIFLLSDHLIPTFYDMQCIKSNSYIDGMVILLSLKLGNMGIPF